MGEDQAGAVALGVTAVVLGPFVWWLTAAAAAGRLRRNFWVGLRISRTLASDDAWVRGHGAALRWTRRTAWATVGLGLTTVALAVADRAPAALTCGLLALAVLLGGLLLAVRDAHRALG